MQIKIETAQLTTQLPLSEAERAFKAGVETALLLSPGDSRSAADYQLVVVKPNKLRQIERQNCAIRSPK